MQNNSLDPEEKSLIYAELMSNLVKKQKLEKQDLFDLLVATAHLREVPVPAKWAIPQAIKDAFDALQIHSKAIEDYLRGLTPMCYLL